jgi:hypothetical protein
MKIIKIFSDYATSHRIISDYVSSNELFLDKNYNITYRFTIDDDYTHAIIVNKDMPKLTIPKENVVGIAQEPPEFLNLSLWQPNQNEEQEQEQEQEQNQEQEFIDYVSKYVSKYYIGEKYNLPEEFVEGDGYVPHCSLPRHIIDKNKIMSIMISQKMFTEEHVYRHKLARIIIDNNLPIDIYGRGCKLYDSNDNNDNNDLLKGEFNDNEHIENYLFHIAIENTQHPHYYTEKIKNPLLYGTNVIYLGCTNIFNYLPDNGIYLLTGNIQTDMNLIISILKDWKTYYKEIDRSQILENISIKKLINDL